MSMKNCIKILVIVLSLTLPKSLESVFNLEGSNIKIQLDEITPQEKDGYLKIKDNIETTQDVGFPELPTYSTLYMVEYDKDYQFDVQLDVHLF